MNLQHLNQFIVAAEELHFGRAAARLGIAQPQLSRSILALEASLGVTLFARTTRQIALTAAGRAFLEEGRKALAQVALAQQSAKHAQAGGAALVRLTFVAPALQFLPAAIRAFRRTWPGAEIALERRSTEEQITGLRTGGIDLGLFGGNHRSLEGLNSEVVARSRFCVLVASDSELAAQPALRMADLKGLTILHAPFNYDPMFHKALMRVCQAHGFEPSIRPVAAQAYTIGALVAAGEGIALEPEAWKAVRLEGVAHLPILDMPEDMAWELWAAWPSSPLDMPAVRDLVEHLKDVARNVEVGVA